MKIYELIYYWDDCAYGCDISNTILVKSQEEVEELKADTYQSLKHASYSLKISIYKIKKLLC